MGVIATRPAHRCPSFVSPALVPNVGGPRGIVLRRFLEPDYGVRVREAYAELLHPTAWAVKLGPVGRFRVVLPHRVRLDHVAVRVDHLPLLLGGLHGAPPLPRPGESYASQRPVAGSPPGPTCATAAISHGRSR